MLDTIGGAGGAWLIGALILGLAELAIPGVFLVFLAIASAITGAIVLAIPTLPLAVQLVAFAVWSGVAVLIGKRWYVDYPVPTADPLLNDRVARLIGEVVTAVAPVDEKQGRVRVGDGEWPARGTPAAIGDRLRITGAEGGVLLVERA